MKSAKFILFTIATCVAVFAQARPTPSIQLECSVADKGGSTPASVEVKAGNSSRLDFAGSRYSGDAQFDGNLLNGKSDLTITISDSKDLKSASESLSMSASRVEVGTRLSSRHIKLTSPTEADTVQVDCVVRSISL